MRILPIIANTRIMDEYLPDDAEEQMGLRPIVRSFVMEITGKKHINSRREITLISNGKIASFHHEPNFELVGEIIQSCSEYNIPLNHISTVIFHLGQPE